MNINRACHSVFYGRLKTYFPEWAILYTTRPGLGLAKPCKSRLFSLLTVHSRPPFPFIFCFLPPVNFGGAAGAVFSPVGFLDEHAAADCTAFQVPIPVSYTHLLIHLVDGQIQVDTKDQKEITAYYQRTLENYL